MHSLFIADTENKNPQTDKDGVNDRKIVMYIGRSKSELIFELAAYGYEVASFQLAYSAELWLKSNSASGAFSPEAVICDLDLPDSDGFAFFESLKADEQLMQTPFILIARHHNALDRIKAFNIGVDDFYSPDVTADDLYNRILMLKDIKGEKESATEAGQIPLETVYRVNWFKRTFDVAFASLLLLAVSPLMLVIGLLIKLGSKGPVFYISKRVGTGYQIFNFYKFRTMMQHAEAQLDSIKHLNKYTADDGRPVFFKVENDPRVTRFGRFLRHTSLDELPQLFNVLKGDMSIVGNRPLPLYEAENLTTDLWSKRFLAPAGITGLWQVSKDKIMSERERKELDVAYAERSSFFFDIKIIIRTIPEAFPFLKIH